MTKPTYCIACRHCLRSGPYDKPEHWVCAQHPKFPGFGFVTDAPPVGMPLYLKCNAVNGGLCQLYEPAPETVAQEDADARF